MRERRYVKFKVDIYDDTKTKIIDQKPERDFIHIEEVKINTKEDVDVNTINITGEENIYVNSEWGNVGNHLGNNDNQENIQSDLCGD